MTNPTIKRSKPRRSVKSLVRSALQSTLELNYSRTAAAGQSTTTTGTVWALTQSIITGSGVGNRSGIQITPQKAVLKIQASINTASTVAAQGFRVIWFADRLNTGTLPTVADVLVANTVLASYTPAATQEKRFIIFHDGMITLGTQGGTPNTRMMKFTQILRDKITYNLGTDVAGANGRHAMFLLIISDQATNPPVYSFEQLLRYYDA